MLWLDHFGLLAPYYDRIFQVRDVDQLIAYVRPEPKHRLLDIGGGTGRVAHHFCRHVAQVCVLDPSLGMLRESLHKDGCMQTLGPTQGNSEELPFADASFDRIIVIDAFHHLRDQQRATREMLRVLVPGGRLVIQEPDIAHPGVKLVALGEKIMLMRSRFYTPEAVGELLRRDARVARVQIEPGSGSALGVTAWVVVDKARREGSW
jgi:demethylmenaquinone methyltransferase/2-methoxy-6-polyprenyl-1,4-benzoquinol methylase